MIDPARSQSLHAKEIRAELERMDMGELVRHGNIYEVFRLLPSGSRITPEHLKLFFHDEWLQYGARILQDQDVYAQRGTYYEVTDPHAAVQPAMWDEQAILSPAEGEMLQQSFQHFGKAMTAKQVAHPDAAGGTPSQGDLTSAASGTLSDFDQFMGEVQGTIIDRQMMADYKSHMDDVQNEVRRMIELAKRGAISPEFILIALAKVNATKNGLLFTWLGKKMFHLNEQLNQISSDLVHSGGADFGAMEEARSKTREGSFQMQLLTTDMQKVMQDVTGTLEQVKSYLDEITRTKREIITKFAAQ